MKARLLLRRMACVLLVFLLSFAGSALYVYSMFGGNAVFPADCAIVFGTAVRPVFDLDRKNIISAEPGPGILRRVSTALELYRSGQVRKLFLTGGRGEDMTASEASVMRQVAIAGGAAPGDVVIEDQSQSTWENLKNMLPLMSDCTTIVGVSDRYHLARIHLWSKVAGHPIMVYPASRLAKTAFEVRSVLREAIGILLTPMILLSR